MVRQAKPLSRPPGPSYHRPAAPVAPPQTATDAGRRLVGTLVILAWLALAVALRSM